MKNAVEETSNSSFGEALVNFVFLLILITSVHLDSISC